MEPLGRPRPLFTTGSPDSPSAGAGFSLAGRPRFFGLAPTTSSTSGILIKRSFQNLLGKCEIRQKITIGKKINHMNRYKIFKNIFKKNC